MPKENVESVEVEPTATVEEEAPVVEEFAEDVETNEDVESSEDSAEETFAEEGKKKADDSDDSDDESDNSDDDEYKKKPGKKCELENQVSELSEQLKELTDKFTALEAEAEELRKFKAERIDADKDAMIAKYHMLSDEDKAEIIADKDKFTLSEIESKLALLYVQKNVNFDEEEEIDSTPLTTFSLDDETIAEDADPILSALREAQNY